MRILVTGATGRVGRRLVPVLRTVGHDISGVARSPVARTQLDRYGAKAIDLRFSGLLLDWHCGLL